MSKTTIDITMPSFGADMNEGTLTEWQVNEGAQINKGDIIAVIDTNKGAIDMESYHTGSLAQILVQPGTTLPVGAILAKLDVADIDTDTDADIVQPEAQKPLPSQPPLQSPQPLQPPTKAQPDRIDRQGDTVTTGKTLASPVVRQIAKQEQLDLTSVKGSGPDGAILLKDIKGLYKEGLHKGKPTASDTTSPARTEEHNLQAIRTAIAAAMAKSKQEIPHYYLTLDIDITRAQQWLASENANREPEDRLLLLAILLKAVGSTLPKFSALNGYYQEDRFEPNPAIHIGNAISLREGGLVVPAIHHVDRLSLNATMQALRDVTTRSRTGHLRSSELTDATITVTSIGDRGSDSVLGVIYPPQVAIIGFGRPRQSLQVKNSKIEICDMINVSLSADHRVSDGALGAKFLNALSNQLQKPESL
ncbi:2-oxo acid dehydrogenase subunit E2 [Photobacterium sp. SDRW27]|uniref:dihydrolipoamide acetyltransferase family protein n=1 Tax=Photobacterium obscurum TaxID=2829490 RepID=UPI0022438EE7|nr:dihydrolipoamide acetyltransferase family protein [Photobacterium obscurum]MCW8331389.1 2-oxo acid dehydrogenase subunit E2 [Photobacterium obscurum]